ncbi:MAG TPA: peptidase [Nitrospirae bacterium]|nr:peptidase [Nitrospirota bacterium]HDK17203.1 peptidase [Nitrospirota bacterium]
MKRTIENIFKINLNLKKTERVIVFTDNKNKNIGKIARTVAEVGKKFTSGIRYLEFRPTGCHGVEPPEEIWEQAFGTDAYRTLKQKGLLRPLISKKISKDKLKEAKRIIKENRNNAVDVVIALSYYSTSHTRFRDFLNRLCGARYASMPLFDEEMLKGPMMVDWKKMLHRTETIAKRVRECENIKIDSPNGTSVTLSKKGREVKTDTGFITKPGEFGNLPAGEVYLAPLEGSAKGRIVLEWAPTRKLKKPVTLYIEKGLVKTVEGEEKYVEFLLRKFSEKRENRNIAELGIGTNDRACRPDNILESEKIFGTIHIALGDNSSFGGKVIASFHQDFVFFEPTVTLIHKNGLEKELMKKGRLSGKH